MEAVVCQTKQVPPKVTRVTSETIDSILSMVKWYRKILTRFKIGSLVKIHQFTKFSSLPIFVLIRYVCLHCPNTTVVWEIINSKNILWVLAIYEK